MGRAQREEPHLLFFFEKLNRFCICKRERQSQRYKIAAALPILLFARKELPTFEAQHRKIGRNLYPIKKKIGRKHCIETTYSKLQSIITTGIYCNG
jgi:hypothetical protein